MALKVTKPQKISDFEQQVQEVIEKIEYSIETHKTKDKPNQDVIIRGEFPRNVLDEVQEIYKKAGWNFAKCITSSENGERPGLTRLTLTM